MAIYYSGRKQNEYTQLNSCHPMKLPRKRLKHQIVEVEKFLKDTSGTMLENNHVQTITHLQIKLMTSCQGLKFTIAIWETWRAHIGYVQNAPLFSMWKYWFLASCILVYT